MQWSQREQSIGRDLKYGVTVVQHQMASADSPGSRWASRHLHFPQMASGGHEGLQTPSSPSLEAIRGRAGFQTRQAPKRPLEVAQGLQGLQTPPRTQGGVWRPSGVVQGASRHLSALQSGVWKHTWVAQGFHVPPGTQTSSKGPPGLQTPPSTPYDLWKPVRRYNRLPDNFAHPTGPLKTVRHRQKSHKNSTKHQQASERVRHKKAVKEGGNKMRMRMRCGRL
jgi:hypothetical protein